MVTSYLYANFAESEIQVAMTAGQTTLQVATADASKFPSPGANQAFRAVIYNNTQREIVECSIRSGNILTVTRGQESTAGQVWAAGAKIALTITAGIVGNIAITSGSISLTNKLDEAEAPAVASAATTNLASITGNFVHVTGTATISSFGALQAGARRIVCADGAFTLDSNANLILPYGGNDIIVDVGDTFTVVGEGASVSRVVEYQRANGAALQETVTGVYGNVGATDNRLVRSNGVTGGLIQGSAVTLDDSGNLSGLGNVTAIGNVSVTGNTTITGIVTQSQGTDVASATSVNLAVATTNFVKITGSTTIETLGIVTAGTKFTLWTAAAVTFKYSVGSMVTPKLADVFSPVDGLVEVVSLGANKWSILSHTLIGEPEVGALADFAGATVPALYLRNRGQAVSRTTYSRLFAKIGTTHGSGDGTTTFNVPDKQGRASVGLEATATRLTSGVSGVDGGTLGASGGNQNMHGHTHTVTDPGHTHGLRLGSNGGSNPNSIYTNVASANSVSGSTESATTGITLGTTGTGTSQNVQPTIVLDSLIYAGQ